ncbi:hypothetical protein D3C71_944200 [compost metagenome]
MAASGENSSAARNSAATTSAVKPVRPPTCTPEALSAKAVVLLVPSSEPATIAVLSASSARPKRFCAPGSFSRPARPTTPYNVPVASNTSTSTNTSTTCSSTAIGAPPLWCSRPGRSSCRKVGARLGGNDTSPWYCRSPNAQPAAVTARMPIRIAPRTRRASRIAISRKPPSASSGGAVLSGPSATSVSSLPMITPDFCSAMIARNRPIPATIADRNDAGMPDTSHARTPVSDSTRNTRPEMNTAASACCQGRPAAPTTVKAKNAFKPMPGAMPTGKLAASAITTEPSAAARQVATNTAPASMPVVPRISGLTKTM